MVFVFIVLSPSNQGNQVLTHDSGDNQAAAVKIQVIELFTHLSRDLIFDFLRLHIVAIEFVKI